VNHATCAEPPHSRSPHGQPDMRMGTRHGRRSRRKAVRALLRSCGVRGGDEGTGLCLSRAWRARARNRRPCRTRARPKCLTISWRSSPANSSPKRYRRFPILAVDDNAVMDCYVNVPSLGHVRIAARRIRSKRRRSTNYFWTAQSAALHL
jgi:hypothetical protein